MAAVFFVVVVWVKKSGVGRDVMMRCVRCGGSICIVDTLRLSGDGVVSADARRVERDVPLTYEAPAFAKAAAIGESESAGTTTWLL
jgi:hypothetical protein